MLPKLETQLNKIHSVLWQTVCLSVSITSFSLILINRSPNFIRPLSMSLRTGFGLVIPATAIFLYLTYRVPGRLGEFLSMVATMTLFAMPLAGLWAAGDSQSTVFSGVIPLYDAAQYYVDALGLINGSAFSIFSARRPLFPGLLSVLLSLTNFNLMISLAILTGIVGLACYFSVREIHRTHGAEMAAFLLMVLFLFYRIHSGISMTENLGVALGALGFGILWRGASIKNPALIWLGLLVTSLGLIARAGAFFVLPLIVLWGAWLFGHGYASSLKYIFIFTSAVILGFVINQIFTRILADPAGTSFANFSYSLYGLAEGGKGWVYVFEAHPELKLLQEPEQSRRIYQLTFELMAEKPWLTVQGAFSYWKMLFSNSWYNVYSYIGGENWTINLIAHWLMYLLCVLGIYAWVRDRKDPFKSLILTCIFGVFISVPFVPPTDAYRMRPYAASIVILAALPALGMFFILGKAKLVSKRAAITSRNSSSFSAGFSIIIILVTLIGPILIKSTSHALNWKQAECPANLDYAIVRLSPGTQINIRNQNVPFLDWLPDYHLGVFRRNSHSLADSQMINWTQSINPNTSLFMTLDYRLRTRVLVVVKTSLLPSPGSILQLCGTFETDGALASFRIFNTETLHVLSN
jgi:hypothetical protein